MRIKLPKLSVLMPVLLLMLNLGVAADAKAKTLSALQLEIQESSEKLRLKLQDKSIIHDFSALKRNGSIGFKKLAVCAIFSPNTDIST